MHSVAAPKGAGVLNSYLKGGIGATVEPYNVASTYALLRDTLDAYVWLERAYREKSQSLGALKTDIAWDNQRSNPRYRDMLQKIGLSR